MQTEKYKIDMINGPILGKILKFSLPMILSGILQLMFNAADIIVVGQFDGSKALAAVGSTTSLIILIINLFIGLSIGSNVVAANHYGAKRDKDVNETVKTSVAMSLYIGIVLGIVGVIFAPVFLSWMGTPLDILGPASTYMRIIFIGMPFCMLYNFGYAVLRVSGDTRRPLYYLMISGAANVGINLLLVIVLDLGVVGVAVGTAVSQAISAILILNCLRKEKGPLHLDMKKLKVDKTKLKQIIKIGLPAGIQGVTFSVSNVIIQSGVNSLGTLAVAGSTAASNVENFIYYSMNPFSQAAITFTGQNVGAGKYTRIIKIMLVSLALSTIVGIGLSALALVFGEPLLNIFTNDPLVIEQGMLRLTCIVMSYALCGAMEVFAGSIRGMGHSLVPMIVSIAGVCGIRLVWVFTVFQSEATITSLFSAYPISWAATVILYVFFFIYYYRKTKKELTKLH